MKLLRSFTFPDYVAGCFIGLYFVIGLSATGHYGVNWDDPYQRLNGSNNWEFITNTNRDNLINSLDRYHGPAFEILLIMLEKGMGLTDPHDIYLSRHYMVFLFFTSVLIAFFLFCRKLFENSWLGLLGMTMLLLCPRIFAEGFYNPKDIVFMGAMVWAMYSLLLFAESPTLPRTILHAFTCALAVDVRVIGILTAVISLLLLRYYVYQKRLSMKDVWPVSIFYTILLFVFMVLMWPILRLDVLEQLWLAYKQMSNYSLFENGINIYMGQQFTAGHTPWHYHWIWILITMPEFYTLLFIAGTLTFFSKLYRRSPIGGAIAPFIFISLFFVFFPLLFRTLTLSTVYDGWRHIYFIYPFFVVLAVYAVSQIPYIRSSFIQFTTLGLLLISMCDSLISMIGMHPYEYAYFNHTARSIFASIDQKFEMDLWGVSYKQGLEYLLSHHTGAGKIRVIFANEPGLSNYQSLPPAQRERFELANDISTTQYYLTNYRTNIVPDQQYLYHSIKTQGNVIMGIYKMQE